MTASTNDNWVRRFIVSDPRKHKKGFTIYKVTSIVFPKASPEAATTVVVWKRYNDFKKLHHELQYKHKKLYLQDKFPPFVKAKFFGRFEDEVIEERRKSATLLLEFIGDHSPLFTSNVFVKFFEAGYSVDDSNDSDPVNQSVLAAPVTVENGNYGDAAPSSVDNQVSSTYEVKVDNSITKNGDACKGEGDGPLLKLGGTWQFPQVPDSISLSSQSSDEHTTFTDTDSAVSSVSTPLQSTDLQLFDPLQQSPVNQLTNSSDILKSQVSNTWLLSIPISSPSEVDGSSFLRSSSTNIRDGSTSLTQQKANSDLEIHSERVEVLSSSEKNTNHGNVELPADMFLSVQSSHFTIGGRCRELESQTAIGDVYLTPPSTPSCTLSNDVSYIYKANYHAGQALEHKANGAYDTAFAFYKAGIACLLSGVQGDSNIKRKRVVREKTARYLLEAEKIYNDHLADKTTESFRWNAPISQLSRPLSELKAYKVLGIINKVMLVLNVLEDHCYVLKVLHKSPCPVSQNKQSTIPLNVPYMVAIRHYFETDSSVFLVLHHASGGRLWDHVSSYFQSLPPTPIHILTRENVYLGKKLIQDEKKKKNATPPSLSTTDDATDHNDMSTLAESNSSHDHSYVELIRDYTSSKLESLLFSDQECNIMKNEKSSIENVPMLSEKITGDIVDDPVSLIPSDPPLKNSNQEVLFTPERMEGGSNFLPDTVDFSHQSSATNDVPDSIPVPDVLPQSNSYSFSWKNLERIDTADLVENAQRLIQSVSETLLRSDIETDSKKSEKFDKTKDSSLKHSSADNVYNARLLESNSRGVCSEVPTLDKHVKNCKSRVERHVSTVSKSIVRCKSEDNSSSHKHKPKERRRSAGRHCSVTSRQSIERRFSSDDLFEGRTRTTSGSLDRGHQWTRLQSVFDRPTPRLPESTVRQWAAELLVCMESLHRWGIICRDLRPENVLLGEKGHLMLTYMCNWAGVDSLVNTEAVEWMYTAPEVTTIFELTPAADWWSFGALVFELVSGKSLLSCHPGGIHSHTILNIPDYVSEEAHSLLTELLRHNPQERLGSGINGVEELKSHPFFRGINWQAVTSNGTCM